MNHVQKYSYDEAHCGYGDWREVNINVVGSGDDVAAAKSFQAHQDQVFGNTGIRSWGFSWADDFTNVHSANFAGMDTSGVISTGGGGSPREDFATVIGNNRHAVFGFDFINFAPTDRVFLDGVRNGYALIEESYFGSVNDQVNNATKKGRPDESDNAALRAGTEPILNIQSSHQGQHNASADSAGFSAKDFGIAHASILAHQGQLGEKNV